MTEVTVMIVMSPLVLTHAAAAAAAGIELTSAVTQLQILLILSRHCYVKK